MERIRNSINYSETQNIQFAQNEDVYKTSHFGILDKNEIHEFSIKKIKEIGNTLTGLTHVTVDTAQGPAHLNIISISEQFNISPATVILHQILGKFDKEKTISKMMEKWCLSAVVAKEAAKVEREFMNFYLTRSAKESQGITPPQLEDIKAVLIEAKARESLINNEEDLEKGVSVTIKSGFLDHEKEYFVKKGNKGLEITEAPTEEAKIGEGSYGTVSKVAVFGKKVGIAVIKQSSEEAIFDVHNEVFLSALLRRKDPGNPHQVINYAVHGIKHPSGVAKMGGYIADLAIAGDLNDVHQRYSLREIIEWVNELNAQLETNKRLGLFIGDIKPKNCLLVKDERGKSHAVIADMGHSKLVNPLDEESMEILSGLNISEDHKTKIFEYHSEDLSKGCDFVATLGYTPGVELVQEGPLVKKMPGKEWLAIANDDASISIEERKNRMFSFDAFAMGASQFEMITGKQYNSVKMLVEKDEAWSILEHKLRLHYRTNEDGYNEKIAYFKRVLSPNWEDRLLKQEPTQDS